MDLSNEKFIDVSAGALRGREGIFADLAFSLIFSTAPQHTLVSFALIVLVLLLRLAPLLLRLASLGYASAQQLVHARARRRFQRGLKRKPMGLIKKLRKAKKEAGPNEKPAMVKTHLRDMIIVPEMIGSVVGVYVSPLIS